MAVFCFQIAQERTYLFVFKEGCLDLGILLDYYSCLAEAFTVISRVFIFQNERWWIAFVME